MSYPKSINVYSGSTHPPACPTVAHLVARPRRPRPGLSSVDTIVDDSGSAISYSRDSVESQSEVEWRTSFPAVGHRALPRSTSGCSFEVQFTRCCRRTTPPLSLVLRERQCRQQRSYRDRKEKGSMKKGGGQCHCR